ncbi:hypothetical protein [Ancylobacter sp. Lp-2]|uniref:hypothetical protein n=1 Tax=Ancylobacter sp. Lp-2 TaxID=2881339 RepID=UPI00351D88AE
MTILVDNPESIRPLRHFERLSQRPRQPYRSVEVDRVHGFAADDRMRVVPFPCAIELDHELHHISFSASAVS